MIDLNFKHSDLLKKLFDEAPFEPEFAVVLGSGLGNFAEKVNTVKSIPTSSLPGYPVSTVQGHQGFIHFAEYANKKLLIFQGRIHFYEGYKLSECILPAFIAEQFKVKYFLLTNAAGGINPDFTPGDLMLITSINAMSLKKELSEFFGVVSLEQKNRFLDFPSAQFNELIIEASLDEKIFLKEGNYFFSKGPSYETPAEIQMALKAGADAVGMSTVHEAIYGAVAGMKVSAISTITNMAAGISQNKLSHSEVIETSKFVEKKFERLVKKIIGKII